MQSAEKPIRVAIVDDHPILRAGMRGELERLSGVELVGEASNGGEALELVRERRPNVVFMDISMPGLNGLEATARISKDFPDVRVIILSRHDHAEYFWHALRVGASGYLLKRGALAELGPAVHRVHGGEIYLSRQISAKLGQRLRSKARTQEAGPAERLSPRQREVLQLIAEGQTTKEIASLLKVSAKTVEFHRAELMKRVGIFDIPGLVRFALRNHLISEED